MIMIRKPNKLPGTKYETNYSKEYEDKNSMSLEHGLLKKDSNVLIVDDLLASGGTMLAASDLIRQAGAVPFVFLTLITLEGLGGYKNILEKEPNSIIQTLFTYPFDSDTMVPTQKIEKLPEKIEDVELFEYRPIKYIGLNNKPVLMWHHSMETMAQTMLSYSNFRASYISWSYFPDKWPNIIFVSY